VIKELCPHPSSGFHRYHFNILLFSEGLLRCRNVLDNELRQVKQKAEDVMSTLSCLEPGRILLFLVFNIIYELLLSEVGVEVPHAIVDVPVARLGDGTHELSNNVCELIFIEEDVFSLQFSSPLLLSLVDLALFVEDRTC